MVFYRIFRRKRNQIRRQKMRGIAAMETLDISMMMRVLRKRTWLIVVTVLFGVLGSGYVSYYVLTPEYEATATIVVQGSGDASLESLYNDVRANQELIKTYGAIIKSRKIAEDVLADLQLPMTTEQLLKKVIVRDTSESLVTSISVVDPNQETAALIANSFARAFQANLNSIMKVDNVSILDEARPSESPVPIRPKPYINMGIAFIVALLGSVGLAFFLEFLDKSIQTEDQVEQLLQLPVLGVITTINQTKAKREDRSERSVQIEGQETS